MDQAIYIAAVAALLAGLLLYRRRKVRKGARHRDPAVVDQAIAGHRTIARYEPRGESLERVTELHITQRRD